MSKKPIFIHSLFRTGSTFIWNKFRQKEKYHCYYEPFHQNMILLNRDNPDLWGFDKQVTDQMNHPPLEKSYTHEYLDLIKKSEKGLQFFKKSFSFDEFCFNGKNPHAFKYINHLIKNTGKKIPVFQFNRSALRAKWFKSNFPGSLNIYIYREPHSQWQSHLSMHTKNKLDIFCVMNLMTAGVNVHSNCFKILGSLVPLVEFHSNLFENERVIYSQLLKVYSPEEQYTIFYYTWLFAFIFNWLNSDLIISVDGLSSDYLYRQKVSKLLTDRGVETIDFSDTQLKQYSKFSLTVKTCKKIEEEVQSVIFKNFTKKQIDGFFKRISEEGEDFPRLRQGKIQSGKEFKPAKDIQEAFGIKYKSAFLVLSNYLLSQKSAGEKVLEDFNQMENRLRLMEQDLKAKNLILTQKDEQLREIDRQLKEKESLLTHKDNTLEVINQQLREKQSMLTDREKQLDRKEGQLAQKNVILKIKDAQLVDLGKQLEQKNQLLENKNKQLVQKVEQLKQRNLFLVNKDQQLVQKEGLLKQKNLILANQDDQLEHKENQLKEKGRQLSELEKQLLRRDNLLKQINILLKERENRLRRKEETIQAILNSKTYQVGRYMAQPFMFIKKVITKQKKK